MKDIIKYGFAQKPEDSEELSRHKALIFWIALVCSVCGLGWGLMYFVIFGLEPVMFLPISFFFIVGTAIFISHKKRNYMILVYTQIFCITFISALIQWHIGSIHESGAVIMWCFLGPVGALIFLKRKDVILWMLFFLFILIVTVIYEPYFPNERLEFTPGTVKFFYIMNVSVALTATLFGSYYFVFSVETEKKKSKKLNKSLTDSINYAKHLQMALLPTDKMIKEVIPNSFVFFKPKEIVSGDFYWVSHIKGHKLFAVVDCTGHGVPGAMVSVICNTALNRSVRELGLAKPNDILNKSREIIIQEFEKSDVVVNDGMDIAICSIDNYKLEFSGAHNPLWIIRNNEIIEIKGDHQAVGVYEKPIHFKNNEVDLQKGDMLYIFSDGYIDQFGGENHKRIKKKGFKNLLIQIHKKPLNEQKEFLDTYLTNWQGDSMQIDDICIMGVRIE